MSKMGDSIVANLDILADSDCQVLQNEKDMLTSIVRLNCTNDFAASEQDAYNILQFLQDETPLTEVLDKAYCFCQAMYLMGIHCKVAKLFVRNVKEYAGILQSNSPPANEFKKNPTLETQLHTRKRNRHISQLNSLQCFWRILHVMIRKYNITFKTCQPQL